MTNEERETTVRVLRERGKLWLCIHVRPRDDGQGWAIDVYDGRRAWTKTHLGERPLNKAEAHRLAHKLRDPKFYTARTKRAVNSGGAL